MPQPARNVGVDDVVPMVIDQGQRGLEQSRHHPRAGQSAYNNTSNVGEAAGQRGSSASKSSLRDILVGRVIPGKEEELETELKAWIESQERRVNATRSPITRAEIKEIVTQVIKETQETQKPREATWAAVAARAPNPHNGPAAKEVPARLEREIVIRTGAQPPDLARRSPQEVIQAIQTTTGREGAAAARRLRSGDTAITFIGNTKAAFLEDKAWVTKVFGDSAAVAQRTYAVLAKGIQVSKLQGVDKAKLAAELTATNKAPVVRCHPRLPRREGARRGAILIEAGTVEAARALCDEGVILQAEIYHAEPYTQEVQPRRCFRCHGYGHAARYCTADERCGRCAAGAHPDGEEACPAGRGGIPFRCANCGGQHAAWSRDCPRFKEQKERAEVAYKERPMTYAMRGSNINTVSIPPPRRPLSVPSTARNPASSGEAKDDFTLVTRKRRAPSSPPKRRGRPPIIARVETEPNQSITGFLSRVASETSPDSSTSIIENTQRTASQDSQWD